MSLALYMYSVHTVNSENFLWSMRTFYTLCTEELAKKTVCGVKKESCAKETKSMKHALKKTKSGEHAQYGPKARKQAPHGLKA